MYSHTDESGKRIYESFTNADYNELVYQVAEFKRGRELEKKGQAEKNDKTLQDVCRKYIEIKSHTLSPSTLRNYVNMTERTMPDIMSKKLCDLTAEDIQREMNILSQRLSPKSVRNYHGFVSAVLNTFRPELRLNTTLPKRIKPDISIPEEPEIKQMLEAAKGTELEIPVALAACCGLRASEIAGLRWDSINFKKNTLTVKEAKVRDADNNIVTKATKTTAGKRTIRLFPFIVDILKEAPRSGDYVVNITPHVFEKRFARMLKKYEIKHYRFHDLRHYCVSVMLSLNIPKSYIAAHMGHETERMIDQVYGHIMASRKTSAEDQMQEYFEQVFSKNQLQNTEMQNEMQNEV